MAAAMREKVRAIANRLPSLSEDSLDAILAIVSQLAGGAPATSEEPINLRRLRGTSYATVAEAAAEVGISERKAWDWIRGDEYVAPMIGNRRIVHVERLRRKIAGHAEVCTDLQNTAVAVVSSDKQDAGENEDFASDRRQPD
jgi:hypothetical protein